MKADVKTRGEAQANGGASAVRGVAVVTGGRRGIGQAICVELASAGFDIAVVDLRDDETAQEAVKLVEEQGQRALLLQLDISQTSDYASFLDKVETGLGPVNCLINNAGIQVPERGDLLEVSEESFDRLIDVNLRGTFFLTQAVAKRMVAREGAPDNRSIVFITSANAHLVSPEKGPYCISKAGLSMASQQYALRLAEHGIGVYEIRPGLIMTDMTADVFERYSPQIESGAICAIRRWGQPQDIARGIATLVTGGMPFSTGDVYNIGGGMQIPRL
ncbi:3-ketoacyl-ACP reductase [Sinorhizobium alkalisoli]|uniref:3-ketoacyl-ACP reductase n=1 Tax=Sinorhizobium alkalisoli TaxID=1752398 RepID=A0A1E3VC25_9HYPH|nr:3-ketoacyl-ACP reductase [Sinorhizobium alkalisoli]MCA1494114.1 3-ketoacyl-ACP reductase [Ensifer sp. NBAIM29]MCG5479992.1 3-ketoacyl-ACP reductase [Sinorhizobium alkalisoli]ODR91134.1 3-ketoacyl-ACP reductase [Sinorhizobium alkalisoli]